jgi:RNA polymerase sigma-70 factor (ECF subfamily)
MSDSALERLLQQLSEGDVAAAEQVFVTYEPYLRKVVRRLLPPHLRARFDSIDVVQSVWADLLDRLHGAGWRFQDAGQLRAFLVQVTRNRFLDRVRQHEASLARERRSARGEFAGLGSAAPPGPSEEAQAGELWERMLALCPPAHREVLHLKRQGLSLEEIAERTGLHVGSLRRILRTLARRLNEEESAHADAAAGSQT